MAVSRPLRWVSGILIFIIAVALLLALALGWALNGSLAQLDGELALEGLDQEATVERDAQGIPTITASNRADTAFALGVLHAQERFFQMDLLRRNSAGELSELVGAAAVDHDTGLRTHQFRQRAEAALANAPERDRKILAAYTRGVNEGLQALSTAPYEYLLLQTDPVPWREADTILALYSMYLDLQPEWNEYERSLAVLKDELPADWYAFLMPEGGEWDSPIQGERYKFDAPFPQQPLAELQSPARQMTGLAWQYRDAVQLGSNNWSVSGDLSPYKAGLVANDMHLGISVPNIWYRASWYLEDGRRVTGATLPGAPSMVVGSNEHIAWGFTNSNGDYHDSVILKTNEDRSQYLTPDGWEPFQLETEVVKVKGGEAREVQVRETRWGPVIGEDHKGNLLALSWVALDPDGANLNSMHLEDANSVAEALDIAATAGMPGQNLNVVDRAGNHAWTIMGRLPNRFGYVEAGIDPREPADWSTGELGWNGFREASDYPRVINPAHDRIWTANARIVSGELLDKVGRAGYALGSRQQQIETGMFDRATLDEPDFLAILLDDRAIFLERWQKLLLSVLEGNSELAELEQAVRNWQGRAAADSVGYLAVKRFREQVIDGSVGAVLRKVEERHPGDHVFTAGQIDNYLEYPTWALVSEQPARHLPAGFASWDDFLTASAEATLAEITEDGRPLAEQTWGKANMLAVQHPLSKAVPQLAEWLDMPAEPMSGDTYMPRVQSRSSGASERMVVAPGHEENGIFHMATGQSGHFLSPYYDYGHRDWVEGNASEFLPGETTWELKLVPAR
ncbi:penicillin acylase family protein [Proteobacteria bacterium 005FR1]|nr:penicillin acylase family protein [Proteobacteria bacterium 005FR1]